MAYSFLHFVNYSINILEPVHELIITLINKNNYSAKNILTMNAFMPFSLLFN